MKYIENEVLELKKSTSELNEAIVSIVAILNKHSSGKLIFGINNDGNVKKDLPSILRNPLIANILFLSEDVEKWGSGLRRIYRECFFQGVKVEFEVLKYGFSVIFYRRKSDINQKEIGQNVDTNVDINPLIRQNWILSYLKENKQIKSKLIQNTFKISREIVSRDLNYLIENNKIVKKGAGNNVWYELK